jgi:hypothetical protein
VPQTLVAPDLDLAADVRRDLTAQVAFELVVLEVVAQGDELLVAEVAHAEVRAHAGGRERLLGASAPDAVDVGERNLEPLLAREVDADEACHGRCLSSQSVARCGAAPVPAVGGSPA